MIEQPQGHRNRHVGVCRALQKTQRKRQCQGAAQHQMVAAVLDQALRDDIGIAIVRRQRDPAPAGQRVALRLAKRIPHAVFGEIRGRRDANQPCDGARIGPRDQQRNPPAHRRSNQNLRPRGARGNHCRGILQPIPDAALLELTLR